MYSEGAFGRGSEPSANLKAISHEPTAEKYSSDVEDLSISCAAGLSLYSSDRAQRNTLVSSKNFMRSFLFFGSASSCGLRTNRVVHRAKVRQNQPERHGWR